MFTKNFFRISGILIINFLFVTNIIKADQYDQYFHNKQVVNQYMLYSTWYWAPYLSITDVPVGKKDDVNPNNEYESFRVRYRWNVSSIPDNATISSATLYVSSIASSNKPNTNFVRWNGTSFQRIIIPLGMIQGSMTKMWGASSTQLYAVGRGGTIITNRGGTWQRKESGTNVHLTDIWGTPDGSEVWACGFNDSNGGGVLLRLANGTWQTVWDRLAPPRPPYIYTSYLSSLWSSGSGEFVAVGGRFYRNSLYDINIVRNEYIYRPDGSSYLFQLGNFAYRVRGTTRNDVWLAGDNAMIWHWNGSTWHRYDELLDSNVSLSSLVVSQNQIVAVGVKFNGIYHNGFVIRGRR